MRVTTTTTKLLVGTLFLLFLAGCGVKAPPVAPQRDVPAPPVNLDCSPQDPHCDKTDPNYKPLPRK